MPDTLELKCCVNGDTVNVKPTKNGNPRMPRGWKRISEKYYSPKAWKNSYCIRAICVPIASPVEIGQGSREEWDKFNEQLAEAWQRSTEAANWALKELLSNDVTRQPGDTKCPAMPPIYLYGKRDWNGWSSSAAAVLRTIDQSYRSTRYEILWRGTRSLPNVKYPYPYPIHNAGWKLNESPDGGIMFVATLPTGRREMRLRGGHKYQRQLTGMRYLMEHPELRGEASIYRRGKEIFVKMVGWFPRHVNEKAKGVLRLETGKTEFLVGLNTKEERLFIFNGNRARRWLIRHENMLQRWREDMKFERRRPKREAKKHAEDMQLAVKKLRNRMSSFIDETAAQCVNHAKRRNLAKIVLDDSERSYFRDFQWYRFSDMLAQKCNAAGIDFERCVAEENTDTTRKNVSEDTET